MTNINIQSIIDSLTTISSKKNYWLVRSMGGAYYDDFVSNSFIAIGYDEIKLSDIHKANTKDDSGIKILHDIIKRQYPDEQRPNYISKQLLDFTYNIKKGDTVIIPSFSTDNISIGVVTDTPVFLVLETPEDPDKCPFQKRKKITWLKKDLPLYQLDPNLLHLKYTRRTITNIDEYTSSIIDRLITPLFIKENNAHLTFDIQQHDGIKAAELFETWLSLFNEVENFGKVEKLDIDRNEFEVRINVQSPGTIEFISYSFVGIVVLSIFVATLIGAEIDVNTRIIKFSIKSEGLIKKVTDYLNNRTDREFKEQMIKKVKKMDIKADEIVKVLEQLNKNQ